MKVFVIGGTGSIGSPLVSALVKRGHEVISLARSNESENALRQQGSDVVRGDIRNPDSWSDHAVNADTIVQVAGTFTEDEGEVDRAVMEALVGAAAKIKKPPKLINTGGCWLYGATHDRVAVESDSLDPIEPFAWAVDNHRFVLKSGVVETVWIHPAMVYSDEGGVLDRFIESAKDSGQVEVWGDLSTRWPVVHTVDLAEAYVLAAERGQQGDVFNVSAEPGVSVADIADAFGRKFGLTKDPITRTAEELVDTYGSWAVGPTIDQQMGADLIKNTLGWTPENVDVLDFIAQSNWNH